jgi:hypothetical protein
MALALAFVSAGCNLPHVKVPHVPDKVHDFNDSDFNNIRKHGSVERDRRLCHDDQGYPYDCNG